MHLREMSEGKGRLDPRPASGLVPTRSQKPRWGREEARGGSEAAPSGPKLLPGADTAPARGASRPCTELFAGRRFLFSMNIWPEKGLRDCYTKEFGGSI